MSTIATDNLVEVWIGASSPLLTYSSNQQGYGWVQGSNGGSTCSGAATFSVDIATISYSKLIFIWVTSGLYQVEVGIDGTLQAGSASSGGATLSSTFGAHTARLEVSCPTCTNNGAGGFELVGVKLGTEMAANGAAGVNATLDDSSTQITYSGFTSSTTSQATIPAIQNGQFYQNTVSYTTSAGATASFTFQGSAIYIFGPTGPNFGTFQITLDSTPSETYNASTSIDTYNTLLYFATVLDSTKSHSIVITNQVDGGFLALDYVVAVQPGVGTAPNTVVPGGVATVVNTGYTTGATAVFPGSGSTVQTGDNGNDTAGAVIGGILGGLAALALLYIWWRYYMYRKAGGEGDFFIALCGSRRKAVVAAKKEEAKFKVWPMLRFRPKYDIQNG